jgi:para-aminobenzoate synthetase
MVTLLIDNYDSYTYIIFQYLWETNGEKPIVVKNNALNIDALRHIPFDNIVISPGSGTPDNPEDVALSMEVFNAFPEVPILGVCLGHQCLGKFFGGIVKYAPREMHGKYSQLLLSDSPLFEGLPANISVVRYHSLIVEKSTLPEELKCIAETVEDGLVMGLQHKERPFFGIQFHPESIGTTHGKEIISNFYKISECWNRTKHLPGAKGKSKRKFRTVEVPWKNPDLVFENLFRKKPYSIWLDNSMPGTNRRYSYMGCPEYMIEARNTNVQFLDKNGIPLEKQEIKCTGLFNTIRECLLQSEMEENTSEIPFKGGFSGYFGYETTMHLDIQLTRYPLEYPEALMMWVEKFITYDYKTQKMYLCSICPGEEEADRWFTNVSAQIRSINTGTQLQFLSTQEPFTTPKLDIRQSQSKEEYLRNISEIKRYLKSGDTYETCLSNEFRVKIRLDSFELYKVLRLTNPAPYSAFIQMPGTAILSSSPECFITVTKEGHIRSEPIKGTRPKGKNEAETEEIRKNLSQSAKDHSELLMIIDLIRNDLSACCEKGSVSVSDFMKITEYATLMQLSAVVHGELRKDVTVVDMMSSAFPGGSITGAPKFRTMQIIDRLENRPRGVYTGSIGYMSLDHAADFSIAIRTLVNHEDKEEISFGSGGAIIAESVPEEEYREILIKGYALLRAIYLCKFGEFETYSVRKTVDSGDHNSEPFPLYKYLVKKPDLENIFQ